MTPICASPSDVSPLWDGWRVTETVDDEVEVGGAVIQRAALAAVNGSAHATGSAAGADASARAFFELVERASLLDAVSSGAPFFEVYDRGGRLAGIIPREDVFPMSPDPERWRPSLSNGVALGIDFASAAEAAVAEVIERDRVLRAWYGETCPVPIELEERAPRVATHRWEAYEFPSCDRRGDDHVVVGVFGFPLVAGAPLLRGSAARSEQAGAVAAACREALQGLAFLWGEPLPDAEPDDGPAPMFHLDRYLWPGAQGRLLAWLGGAHRGRRPLAGANAEPGRATFADLTPPPVRGRFRVLRALVPGAEPLIFGVDPNGPTSHLPPELRAHPIA